MIANFILSGVITVLSCGILYLTSQFKDFSNFAMVGPEVVPNCLAAIMLILSAIIFFTEIFKIVRQKNYVQEQLKGAKELYAHITGNKRGLFRILGTLALMFLFGAALRTVGFEICGIVFLVSCMLMNGVRSKVQLVVIPLVTAVVVYGLFVYFLRVNIPMLFF